MGPHLTRRATLLLPLLLAACGGDDEAEAPAPGLHRDFPPLRYGYLPPINLNVQRMGTAGDYVPPTGDNEFIGYSPINPVETLFAMARDRLKPVGQSGTATFRVLTASIVRHHDELDGVLAVRLDIKNGDGTNAGFAEARVTVTHNGSIDDRQTVVYDMMKQMMFQMNVELEYQLRNKLKGWLVDTATGTTPPAQPAPEPNPPAPNPVAPASPAAPEPSAAVPEPSAAVPNPADPTAPMVNAPPPPVPRPSLAPPSAPASLAPPQ